jgi:hypothetical protein
MAYCASYGRSEVHWRTFSLLSQWPRSYVAFHAPPFLLLQRVDVEPDFPVVTPDARRRKSIL